MLAKERQLMDVLGVGVGGVGPHRAVGGGGGVPGVSNVLQAAMGWRPGVGGIVQRPYSQDTGFCVFWDYLMGLPKRSGSRVIGKVRGGEPDGGGGIPGCERYTWCSYQFRVVGFKPANSYDKSKCKKTTHLVC